MPSPDVITGWPPGMLQDDSKKLSKWLAGRIDSRRHAREAAAAIQKHKTNRPCTAHDQLVGGQCGNCLGFH